MQLTPGQKAALANLADKKVGVEVGFINIRDAAALVGLGLAERGPSGWTISPSGEALSALAKDVRPDPDAVHIL